MSKMGIGSSIGLELEFDSTSRRFIKLPQQRNLSDAGFGFTNDASVESTQAYLDGINKNGPSLRLWGNIQGRFPTTTFGGEIRSNIIDTTNVLKTKTSLDNLCRELKKAGETSKSARAGIHVHVNSPDFTLNMLKSLIKTGALLEPVFFALGGMGYSYRGKDNNSTYCRPITSFGPPVVKTARGNLTQVFNLNSVFAAESVEEFFELWGDAYVQYPRNHMYPVRYVWLNLASLLTRNSTEFRIFNKSLCPEKIWAVMVFCQEVVKYSIKHSFSKKYLTTLDENSIYYVNSKEEIREIFTEFVYSWEIPEGITEILINLLDDADYESIKVDPGFYYTHLMFHDSGDRTVQHWKSPKFFQDNSNLPTQLVNRPVFYDSHSMTEESKLQHSPLKQGY